MNTSNEVNTIKTEAEVKPLSLRKASLYLGVSTGTMLRLCESGEIPHARFGHKFRISMLDLDLYRAEHTVEKVAQ